jgi:hypothetical protein
MHDQDIEDLRAAIAALVAQRTTLGDAVLALATAPLHCRWPACCARPVCSAGR